MSEEIDTPSERKKCKCGLTYFHFDNNPCLGCTCDFYNAYEVDRFGDDEDFDDTPSPIEKGGGDE